MSTADNRIVGLIPARGGSKGIPGKNAKLLDGIPLIAHTIRQARAASELDRVLVSTDCMNLADIARNEGAEVPFMRPPELAGDSSTALHVMLHAIEFLEREGDKPDALVYLQPTSPLRKASDIDQAVRKFTTARADTVVSIVEVPHQYAPSSLMTLGTDMQLHSLMNDPVLTRQEKPAYVARNGPAILIVRTDSLLRHQNFYSNSQMVVGFPMPAERSVDIDKPWDLFLAEAAIKFQTVKQS